MMMTVLAAVLLAAPLSAQASAPAADAWRRMPVADARLRVERAPPQDDVRTAEWRSLSSVQWMLLGGVVGCVAGALLMASGADAGEKQASGANGCILGGSAGMFLGGVYSLAAGAMSG